MSQEPDPTLRLLRDLEDESRWKVVRAVPIFCAHERSGKDGRKVKVSRKDLESICETYRRLKEKRGVVPRLMIGHTRDDAPEKSQPEIVGWMKNLRVGKFGPAGEEAVLADFYYRPECYDEARTYPFRSPEYYQGRQEISSVALLRRDPQLDLGILYGRNSTPVKAREGREKALYYERDGRPFFYFSEANPMPGDGMPDVDPAAAVPGADTPDDADFQKFLSHCDRDPVLKYVRTKYAQEAQAPPAPPPGPMPAMPPGGGGGMPPEKMARQADLLRYQQEVADLRAEISRERHAAKVARYRRDLEVLAEDYQLDVEEELKDAAGMDEAAFTRLKTKITSRYERNAPVGGPMLRTEPRTDKDPDNITDRHRDLALDYMRRHDDCEFEDAVEKTREAARKGVLR